MDEQGAVLGVHQGISRYTLGQRRGLGIASDAKLYVKELDAAQNRVVLSGEEALFARQLIADEVSFQWLDKLEAPMQVQAKIRYAARPAPATIEQLPDGAVLVKFEQPQRAITPGQAVVFYQDDTVVGGGTIRHAVQEK